MTILYFDCFSGISGDMTIGALIDAGGDPEHLEEELKKLHLTDAYQLKWESVIKNGITSTTFDVVLNNGDSKDNGHTHSHDHHEGHTHEHTHSHDHHDDHTHDHTHSHADHNGHTHDHTHDHAHHEGHTHDHTHDHEHRTYRSIVDLIESSDLSEDVKDTSLCLFRKIGEAEGRIHGIALDDVHFHEVGAIDSIIDIVGTAILLDYLAIDTVKVSEVPVGSGSIKIDHGVYPVPAPATLEILKGVPIASSNLKAELTTPTGAAIAAVLGEEFCTMPDIRVKAIGYGAGTKTFDDHPNVLRAVIGE